MEFYDSGVHTAGMMENLFKLVITAFFAWLIWWEVKFVIEVWRSQIDPRATASRLVDLLKPDQEVIATRDPTKIYQGGKPVGDVVGDVVTQPDSKVLFKMLGGTADLDQQQPFDYKRSRLRILNVGRTIGMYSAVTSSGTTAMTNVLQDVLCEPVAK